MPPHDEQSAVDVYDSLVAIPNLEQATFFGPPSQPCPFPSFPLESDAPQRRSNMYPSCCWWLTFSVRSGPRILYALSPTCLYTRCTQRRSSSATFAPITNSANASSSNAQLYSSFPQWSLGSPFFQRERKEVAGSLKLRCEAG